MHLTRIEIRNFRNFDHLTLDPFPSRAVIVGENGVGKTNFLSALRLVLDPSLPDTKRVLRSDDVFEGSEHSLREGTEVRVSVDICGFEHDSVAVSVLDGCIVSTEPYTARLTYLFQPSATVLDGKDVVQPAELTVDDYSFIVFGGEDEDYDAQRVRRHVSLAVLPALRDAVGDLGNAQRSPLTELIEHLPPEDTLVQSVAGRIDDATATLTSDDNLQLLEERIGEQVKKLAGPQLQVQPTLGLNPSRPEQLIRSLRLFVDQERTRGVADTSTGNANVIYLALLLERLAARREAERNVATLLSVEEPEAHLHPGLQRHLFSYLLRHGPNLLLTTHSPNITAVSPLESIVLLHGGGARGATTGRTAIAAGLAPAEIHDLERYLDVTRAEALFARFVILVEGIAELYLVPAVARLYGFELDAWGVVVTSIGGTDFGPYHTMLSSAGFNINHAVLTDGDRAKGMGYLGLARSVRLVDAAVRAEFTQDVDLLREQADAQREIIAVATAWLNDVFVGLDTLELDMAAMLREEMKTAFADLARQPASIADFNAAIDRLADRTPRDGDAKTVIGKIENFGKGRFAQRLASVLETVDAAAFRQRCATLYPTVDDPTSGLTTCLNLLAALNAASRAVRGVGMTG